MSDDDDDVTGPDDVIYCSECGEQNLREANYCQRCGTSLAMPEMESEQSTQQTSTNTGTTPEQSGDSGWLTRRRLIGGGLAAVIGGGIAYTYFLSGPQHELANPDEAWEGVTEDRTRTSQSISGTVTLQPGEFTARFINPPQTVNYRIHVELNSGNPIDIFTMQRSTFSDYRETAEDVLYLSPLTETSVQDTILTNTLGAGDYVTIIDNTGVYGAAPDGETATANITISASV